MEYIASISGGANSIILPHICREYGYPLDFAVHSDLMATDKIPALLPDMMRWKQRAFEQINRVYGIEVKQLKPKETYEHHFYRCRVKGEKAGQMYGWPFSVGKKSKGNWCNSDLKMPPLDKIERGNMIYVGIAADETNRLHILSDKKRSPLVDLGITTVDSHKLAQEIGLYSPTYTHACRDGCWFCHNQSVEQLRYLRKQYPEYWALMLKWDNDSPVTFKPDGRTVHDFDRRFQLEDEGFIFDDDKIFRWDMLKQELNYRWF